MADGAHPDGQRPTSRVRSALVECRGRILRRVREASEQSLRAVLDTAARLTEIVEDTRGQAGELEKVAGAIGSGHGGGVVEALLSQSQEVSAFAEGLTDHARLQAAQTHEAVSATRRISRIARDVEGIGARSKILTLNARIECARLGEHGRALQALAAEMSTMSQEILKANGEIEELARTLDRVLPQLERRSEELFEEASGFGVRFAERQSRTTRLLQDLLELVSSSRTTRLLQDLLELVSSPVAASRARVDHVVHLSYAALESLQFQEPMAQELGGIDGELSDAARALDVDIGAPAPRPAQEAHEAHDAPAAQASEILLF